MSKKTYLSVAKLVCGERVLAFIKVGIYKARNRAELERNASIMECGQKLALPVILDDIETNNPTRQKYELLFNAIEVPASKKIPQANKDPIPLIIHADNEDDALMLISELSDISVKFRDTIEKLGMSTRDLVSHINAYKSDGLTTEQAIAELGKELENQRTNE